MRVTVVTPPEPIITFEGAARHLRLGSDQTEKLYVEGLIAAATATIDGPEGWLGRSLGAQTLEARFDAYSCGRRVRLPYGPVISLVGVEYLDRHDEPTQAETDDFELLGADLVPIGSSFAWEGCSLRPEAIRVQYLAGYEDDVPAPVKAAVLLMVGDLYRNRGEALINQTTATVAMSTTVAGLLRPLRVFR